MNVDMNPDLLALSIQQPWAELILRGIKTIEVRRVQARPQTQIYLYASQRLSTLPGISDLISRHEIQADSLPRGMIVGTVDIVDCRQSRVEDAAAAQISSALLVETYSWVLGNPQRLSQPVPPRYVPFGTWFYPFKRLRTNRRHRSSYGGD